MTSILWYPLLPVEFYSRSTIWFPGKPKHKPAHFFLCLHDKQMSISAPDQLIYSVNRSRSVQVWDSKANSSMNISTYWKSAPRIPAPFQLRRSLYGLTVLPAQFRNVQHTSFNYYSWDVSMSSCMLHVCHILTWGSHMAAEVMTPKLNIYEVKHTSHKTMATVILIIKW